MYSVEEMTANLPDLVKEIGDRGKRGSLVVATDVELLGNSMSKLFSVMIKNLLGNSFGYTVILPFYYIDFEQFNNFCVFHRLHYFQ